MRRILLIAAVLVFPFGVTHFPQTLAAQDKAAPAALSVPYVVASVAIAPDGKMLATCGGQPDVANKGVVTLWNLPDGKTQKTFDFDKEALSVAFSPDGKHLVVGFRNHGSVKVGKRGNAYGKVFETGTGKLVATLDGHRTFGPHGLDRIAYDPQGRYVATSGFDGIVRLWEPETGKLYQSIDYPNLLLTTLTFSPDGKRLAIGGGDQTIKLWDPKSGKELAAFKHDHSCLRACFSPDGRHLAVCSSGIDPISLWTVDEGKRQRVITVKGEAGNVTSNLAFSPDGRFLLTGNGQRGRPGELVVWDVGAGKKVTALKGFTSEIGQIVFTADAKTLAVLNGSNAIRLLKVLDVLPK